MRLKSSGLKAIKLSTVPNSPCFWQTRTVNISVAGCVVVDDFEKDKVNLVVFFFCQPSFYFPYPKARGVKTNTP